MKLKSKVASKRDERRWNGDPCSGNEDMIVDLHQAKTASVMACSIATLSFPLSLVFPCKTGRREMVLAARIG